MPQVNGESVDACGGIAVDATAGIAGVERDRVLAGPERTTEIPLAPSRPTSTEPS
jgi:hypothetical protein